MLSRIPSLVLILIPPLYWCGLSGCSSAPVIPKRYYHNSVGPFPIYKLYRDGLAWKQIPYDRDLHLEIALLGDRAMFFFTKVSPWETGPLLIDHHHLNLTVRGKEEEFRNAVCSMSSEDGDYYLENVKVDIPLDTFELLIRSPDTRGRLGGLGEFSFTVQELKLMEEITDKFKESRS